MIKYYRNSNNGMIHAVSDFPEPKTEGYSNCGMLSTIKRMSLTRSEIRAAANYEFCKKCQQLIGIDHETAL